MALIWSPRSLDDVQELIRFLDNATEDATTGNSAASLVLEAADRHVGQPHIDKSSRDDMREWSAVFGAGAQVSRYRVTSADDILIVRVWHSREDRDLR